MKDSHVENLALIHAVARGRNFAAKSDGDMVKLQC